MSWFCLDRPYTIRMTLQYYNFSLLFLGPYLKTFDEKKLLKQNDKNHSTVLDYSTALN